MSDGRCKYRCCRDLICGPRLGPLREFDVSSVPRSTRSYSRPRSRPSAIAWATPPRWIASLAPTPDPASVPWPMREPAKSWAVTSTRGHRLGFSDRSVVNHRRTGQTPLDVDLVPDVVSAAGLSLLFVVKWQIPIFAPLPVSRFLLFTDAASALEWQQRVRLARVQGRDPTGTKTHCADKVQIFPRGAGKGTPGSYAPGRRCDRLGRRKSRERSCNTAARARISPDFSTRQQVLPNDKE